MLSRPNRSLSSLVVLAMLPAGARAQTFVQRVVTGLDRPVGFAAPPGDPTRGFIIEAFTGNIKVVDLTNNTVLPTPFLQITDLDTGFAEQGLLGITFDPEYGNNGYFYLNYTAASGDTHVVRYQAMGDPMTSDVADPNSKHVILIIQQPGDAHNAGWMEFSPHDGYFYIATGDGGGGEDKGNGHTPETGNAQDISDNLLGKMLRLDVHGDDFPADPDRNYAIPPTNPFVGSSGDDEIWAYGLRNPWRNSFDRETGDLWIGDVGQTAREEINTQPADSPGGANYGWRLREGNIATPTGGVGGPEPPGHIAPVYDYSHAGDDPEFLGRAVVGGYVYRGSVDEFVGHYIFADNRTTNIWTLDPDAVDIPSSVTNVNDELQPNVGTLTFPASFGEDANGELYLVDLVGGGDLFRIATSARDAVWNGDSATAGQQGNGVVWGDENNWTRDGVVDAPFIARDTAVFEPGSSQSIIDLVEDQSVGAAEFNASYTLRNASLHVLSGNVSVAPGVMATIESNLAAQSIHHSIRKLGEGTLLVEGNAGQTVVKEGLLGGSGSFDHLTIRSGGTVTPGSSIGIVNVDDSFRMDDGAVLSIEIAGSSPSEFDVLNVGGNATLDGELDIRLLNGFQPSIGDEFEFLTAASVEGSFASLSLPELGEGMNWSLQHTGQGVALIVDLLGDYNGDGTVNAADYVVWRDMLGTMVPGGSGADGNHSGDIDAGDYAVWKDYYGQTGGSRMAGHLSAPEPTTSLLFVLGLLPMAIHLVGRRTLFVV